MAQSRLIFIGIAGTVVALDRATGTEVWRSDLKGKDFVNVALQESVRHRQRRTLLSRSINRQYPLAKPVEGFGLGFITIAASGSQQAVVMGEKKQRDAAAAGSSGAT